MKLLVRRRAMSLLEGLVAGLILAVVIVGLYSLWGVAFGRIQKAGETVEAGQLARAELERAKVFGAKNLPSGVFNPTTQIGTWAGAFDPTLGSGVGGWVTGGSQYFDITGTRVASEVAPGARFAVSLTAIDTGVLSAGGTAYAVDGRSRRALVATVRRLPEGTIAFQSATNLVVGGL